MLIFLASLAVALASFIIYPEPTFSWQQWQELQRLPLNLYEFESGGFPLTIKGENLILLERWAPNVISFQVNALDYYLLFLFIGLVLLLAYITTLPRIWFFLGAGGVLFMISAFQLEVLGLAGFENRYPSVAVMIIWVFICAYYQYFNRTAGFLHRLVVIFVFFLIAGISIAFLAHASSPFRMLAARTFPVAMVALVFFMILVAHEIIAAFLFLVGQGNRRNRSLQHFLTISGIYLLVLWIGYWNKIGWMDWNLSLHPVILLSLSSVLALWGFRHRITSLLPEINEALALCALLGLGIISFGSINLLYSTSEDIALLSLKDIILYTHIGYGMMFLVYIASNFLGPLAQNLPVYRILYKPTAMPYFSYMLAGLIFTLAFVFYNRWMVPLNHTRSAYYTLLGDVYAADGDMLLARGYYQRGHDYAPYNQHASTALAQIEETTGSTWREEKYLQDANLFKPTEFTLINGTRTFGNGRKTIEELILLQEAHSKLPHSGIISNNLGLAYTRVALTDSATAYFGAASKDPRTRTSAEINLLALWVKEKKNINPDSISLRLHSEHPNIKVNMLALANQNQKVLPVEFQWPADSAFTVFSATLLGNSLINQLNNPDTAFISRSLHYARHPKNAAFKDVVFIPAAHACYAAGQITRAVGLLQELIFDGHQQGALNKILGLWSLDQGKPDVARNFFLYAINQNDPDASWLTALSLAEAGQRNESLVAWDSLQRSSKDSVVRKRAESMMRVVGGPPSWYPGLSDREKFQFLHYQVSLKDSALFDRMVAQITDPHDKARAILSRSKKYFDLDEVPAAIHTFLKLQGLQLTDPFLFQNIQRYELRLLAAQGQIDALREAKSKVTFGACQITPQVYYAALQQWAAQDTIQAGRNLEWLAFQNPWFDEAVVSAAAFFEQHGHDQRKPYRILSEALQINPHSVRILKAYVPAALESGYDTYALGAMETLESLISPEAFQRYKTALAQH